VRGLKDEAEMEAIADALEKTRWCRKDAAKMLGISYKASSRGNSKRIASLDAAAPFVLGTELAKSADF
jgi:hypothetical protein